MNSIQLISKIKSKSEDLQIAVQELNGEILPIQKELLKKNCIELFEMVLKIKTTDEIVEDKKSEIKFEIPVQAKPEPIIETIQTPEPQLELNIQVSNTEEKPIKIEIQEEEITAPEIATETNYPEISSSHTILEPTINFEPNTANVQETVDQTALELENNPIQQSFNDFIKQINQEKATLNDLEKTAETIVETEKKVAIEIQEPIQSTEEEASGNFYFITPPEFNIDRAVENKRIQKTVMPDPEPLRKVSLNDSVSNTEANFNDRFAERVNTHINPIVEKSIDSPIENMKTEIGLNKKIAFVNLLFAENVVEYAKAIDKLNQAPNIEEGLKLFNELSKQFTWDSQNNPLVAELKQLLHRRHQA
jgi:hypothetical protein